MYKHLFIYVVYKLFSCLPCVLKLFDTYHHCLNVVTLLWCHTFLVLFLYPFYITRDLNIFQTNKRVVSLKVSKYAPLIFQSLSPENVSLLIFQAFNWKCIYFYLYLFIFYYCSSIVVSIFTPPWAPHPTHPHLPPSNIPLLALSMCPLYIFLDGASPICI